MTLLLGIMLIAGTNLSWWWITLLVPVYIGHLIYHSHK